LNPNSGAFGFWWNWYCLVQEMCELWKQIYTVDKYFFLIIDIPFFKHIHLSFFTISSSKKYLNCQYIFHMNVISIVRYLNVIFFLCPARQTT
jgi:hypothetical protein